MGRPEEARKRVDESMATFVKRFNEMEGNTLDKWKNRAREELDKGFECGKKMVEKREKEGG